MKLEEHHKKQIKKTNQKFPMMEYFLDGKQLKDCSKECQEQIQALKDHEYELVKWSLRALKTFKGSRLIIFD